MEQSEGKSLGLEDLRRALNATLDEVIERFGPKVSLHAAGYYWHLPYDTAYAFDDDAESRIGVGDTVQDDVEAMDYVLANPDREDRVLSHELAALAELLRWLAFHDSPRDRNRRRVGVTDANVLALPRRQRTPTVDRE